MGPLGQELEMSQCFGRTPLHPVYTLSVPGMVFFYDLEKRKMLSSGGPFCGAVSSMAWHPEGKFLVLGLEVGNLHGLILEGGNITELEAGRKAVGCSVRQCQTVSLFKF